RPPSVAPARAAPPPPVGWVHERVLRRVLVTVWAVCLRALVLGAVEPLGRAVPIPPVVVHDAQAATLERPVAAVDRADGGTCGVRLRGRGEVREHPGCEVVVDETRTCLATPVDLVG